MTAVHGVGMYDSIYSSENTHVPLSPEAQTMLGFSDATARRVTLAVVACRTQFKPPSVVFRIVKHRTPPPMSAGAPTTHATFVS